MKRLLVLGYGTKAGSWQIRGAQLGEYLSATVINGNLSNVAVDGFDLALAVKRPRNDDLKILRNAGIPIVWDIVDAWPQPIGNWWARDVCMSWVKGEVKRIKPCALVVNTKVMAEDCARFNLPTLILPHHHRPGITVMPQRAKIKKIGYEGGVHYLGRWLQAVSTAACKRGLEFVTNPYALADLDIVVAFREPDGYAVRNWKSNVKLANAQGAGVPCILNREAAYLETASGAEMWADKPCDLDSVLDELIYENGSRSFTLQTHAPTLAGVGSRYRDWLEVL